MKDSDDDTLARAYDLALFSNALALALEYHRETTAYALSAIRNASLINGGGVVGLLAFAQNLAANARPLAALPLIIALALFSLGLLFAVTANFWSYFAHLRGTSRAVYDALHNAVIVRNGFNGELSRFGPQFSDAKLDAETPKSYIERQRIKHHKAAEGPRTQIIILLFASYTFFSFAAFFSAYFLLEALASTQQDSASRLEGIERKSTNFLANKE